MIDREYIESQPNWQCTVQHTRSGRFVCLMHNIKGGFYWYTPSYKGVFTWGATNDCVVSHVRSSLADGTMRLVAGELPAVLRGES